MRFTHPELQAFRGSTLPDLVGPAVKFAVRRFQSGLRTVAVQAHFAFRGNRFIRRSSGPALSIG
jgi:double-stranded uracil-DNA glycosylase